MTITFDDALDHLVQSVEQAKVSLDGCELTILRDLVGNLRLLATRSQGRWAEGDKQALKEALQSVKPYGTGIIVFAEKNKEFPLKDTVESERKPFDPRQPARAQWFLLDRRFSKDSWLENEKGAASEPWPFEEGSPVISFYGFKGGVGRSTAVAAMALHLADHGKRIVVIDLDLEAPGVAGLLGPEIEFDLGVVDYLVEHRFQRSPLLPLSRFYMQSPLASGAGDLKLFGAGTLNRNYLEKLGRLDLQGGVDPAYAVRGTLLALLKAIKSELVPDAILLDVRAGLHDLGGVSLSGLSHLELIFAVHTPQTWAGLPLVLEHLGRLRADWVKLVHTMVPPASRGGNELHEDFIAKAYKICTNTYYLEGKVPGPQDTAATHFAHRLPFREQLMALADLRASRSELLSDEHRVFCEAVRTEIGL